MTTAKTGQHTTALWQLFSNRSTNAKNATRLTTLLSTKPGVYGTVKNQSEVPRGLLLDALKKETNLHASDDFAASTLCDVVQIALR
jgi:hypothetical protein